MVDRPPPSEAVTSAALEALRAWLEEASEYPMVDAVVEDESSGLPGGRWFLRLTGDAKSVWSLWIAVHQRSLHLEAYFTPAPERNAERFYEHLLRRNRGTDDVAFCIGEEDAIFLRSRLALERVGADELDRLLGAFYTAVEDSFATAVRLSFAK
ncbi:MAG: YbjN domain-containing protein [Microthrixaceae bacterium]